MRRLLLKMLFASTVILYGCDKDKIAPEPELQLRLLPLKAYQEALPGAVINFQVQVKSLSPVTGFNIRFRLPGSNDFVALPEYPDLANQAAVEFTSRNQLFQYALPPSAVAMNAEAKIRFTVSTASLTEEKDYTVKMMSTGLQWARLYSPEATSYFNFSALDLTRGITVPEVVAASTKDLVAATVTTKYSVTGETFDILVGWNGANGTRFKPVTAAQYSGAATAYPGIYTGIAAANELTGVSKVLTATTAGIGVLAVNNYYIARVNRNNALSYVGIAVKKVPVVTATTIGTLSKINLTDDYLDIELKK